MSGTRELTDLGGLGIDRSSWLASGRMFSRVDGLDDLGFEDACHVGSRNAAAPPELLRTARRI